MVVTMCELGQAGSACFICMILFNLHYSPVRWQLLSFPFYRMGDRVREKLCPFHKVSQPLGMKLGLDSKLIRFRGCPCTTMQLYLPRPQGLTQSHPITAGPLKHTHAHMHMHMHIHIHIHSSGILATFCCFITVLTDPEHLFIRMSACFVQLWEHLELGGFIGCGDTWHKLDKRVSRLSSCSNKNKHHMEGCGAT